MKIKLLCLLSSIILFPCFAFGINSQQTKLAHLQYRINNLQNQINQLKSSAYYKKTAKYRRKAAQHVKHKRGYYTKAGKFHPFISKHKRKCFDSAGILGTPVVTAPFLSQPTYYSGSDLIVNAPSINEDMKLLNLRRAQEKAMLKHKHYCVNMPKYSHVQISGKLEAQALYENPYVGRSLSDVDLSGAELDVLAEVTPWINGFIGINYDNLVGDTPRRISNSRIKLDKGFIVIGNLSRSSFYGSIGQLYVPFGRYASNMISDPLTKFIGKTKARAVVLAYASQAHTFAPYARVFLFRGDSRDSHVLRQNGADAGFHYSNAKWNSDLGIGYIGNIADSEGFQSAGADSAFHGFDVSGFNGLAHSVNGIDAHAELGYGPLDFLAEYVTALQRFSASDLTYNMHGAKPSALHVEGDYTTDIYRHPISFGLGYGFSWQALGLNIPEQRYTAVIAMTILNNTIAKLEFRHDINYGKGDSATGLGSSAFTAAKLGKVDNAVTAQLGIYF